MCICVAGAGVGFDQLSVFKDGVKVLHANSNSFWIWMVGDQCSLYHTFNFKLENFDKKHWKIGAAYPSVESCEEFNKIEYLYFLFLTYGVHTYIFVYTQYILWCLLLYFYNFSSNIWKTCSMTKYNKERSHLKCFIFHSFFLEQRSS